MCPAGQDLGSNYNMSPAWNWNYTCNPKNVLCDAVPFGKGCGHDFMNPPVLLGERVRHDLGVTFAGACRGELPQIVLSIVSPKA